MLSHDSSSGGSAACPPSSQSPSNSTCIRRSQEIAHRALLTYSQAHGSVSETPSVESIMSAYKQDGNGDRDLLIAILDAKKVEDERLAARDQLETERLRARNLHLAQRAMIRDPSPLSRPQPAPVNLPLCSNGGKQGVIRRQVSFSSASSTSSWISPRPTKRVRQSPEGRRPQSSAETTTREEVKFALEAKIARSGQAQFFSSKLQAKSRPSIESMTNSVPILHSAPVFDPLPPRSPRAKSAEDTFVQAPQAAGTRTIDSQASIKTPPQTSPTPSRDDTQLSSPYTRVVCSNPSTSPISPSRESYTSACTEASPDHHRLSSSLARLLNGTTSPAVC